MKTEVPYEFRNFLEQVHSPDRRNPQAPPCRKNEVKLDESWRIVLPETASAGLTRAALDFQNYLLVSMNLSLKIEAETAPRSIVFSEKDTQSRGRGYDYEVTADRVTLLGDSWIGAANGGYFLEDLMNLREQPILERTGKVIRREPLFSPRMTHSGYGLDQFPDAQLSRIAHAGFDSIILFVTGPDMTRQGPLDFHSLIRRALEYGLDTYFYSYLDGYKHPDESGADAFFDSRFGALFRHSPEAKGLILVSESCEFPTKDPRANSHLTTPGGENPYTQGICGDKPGSGWFPCSDYPQWVDAVKNACRKYNPEADIIFWTYGFGRSPQEAQREMVLHLSGDVSLMATFEMYEQRRFEHHTVMQPDYSITFPGPSRSYDVQADAAHEAHLRLYSMTNTAGRTWDLGTVPYIPVPQQWFKRYEGIHRSRRNQGLSGLMDSHHFGWYPGVIAECSKWSFWSPECDMGDILRRIAVRDFCEESADKAVEAWALWSESMNYYAPSFGDQCGPLRVGAAYPLVFLPYLYPFVEQEMKYPMTPLNSFGARLIHPAYFPEMVFGGTACGRMMHEDIRHLETKVLPLWEKGEALMEEALASVPEFKKRNAEKILGVGKFFGAALRTMLHTKRWFILNRRIEIEPDLERALEMIGDMKKIIAAELENVKAVLPYADNDSALGWEPRMDYVGGAWHLRWKIRQLENLRDNTLNAYAQTLSETPPFERKRSEIR